MWAKIQMVVWSVFIHVLDAPGYRGWGKQFFPAMRDYYADICAHKRADIKDAVEHRKMIECDTFVLCDDTLWEHYTIQRWQDMEAERKADLTKCSRCLHQKIHCFCPHPDNCACIICYDEHAGAWARVFNREQVDEVEVALSRLAAECETDTRLHIQPVISQHMPMPAYKRLRAERKAQGLTCRGTVPLHVCGEPTKSHGLCKNKGQRIGGKQYPCSAHINLALVA